MVAKRVYHHFVPHHHPEIDESHRAHALEVSALFSYALVFSLLTAGLFIIRVSAPKILGTITFSSDQIISLTNAKRGENGLGALSANSQLSSAASAKASDMFANNYWAHTSPSGKTPWSFIKEAGYKYIYAGENLAKDFTSADAVVNAWMNSAGHRSNILDKNFKEIGVAVASGTLDGKEGILVVQMFGSAVSQVNTQPLAIASPIPSPAASPVVSVSPNVQPSPVAVAVSSPSPIPTEEPSPTIEPTPSPAGELAFIEENTQPALSSTTVLASRQFSIAKIISLFVIGFIFGLFVLEVFVVSKRAHLKLRSTTLAHLGLLGFLLLVIWYAVQGAVA